MAFLSKIRKRGRELNFSENKISQYACVNVDTIVIRCSSTSLKFANAGKRANVQEFLRCYREAVIAYVDRFWNEEKLRKFADDTTLDSPISARAKQCAAKQALAIVRGTKEKNRQREWRLAKLLEEGKVASAKRLQDVIDKNPSGKPSLDSANAELDSRFISVNVSPDTKEFDLWVTLSSLGTSKSIKIPLRKHRQFNKLSQGGSLRPSIRVSNNSVTFFFESQPPLNKNASVLGIDIGSKHTLSSSDGQQTQRDNHGWALAEIQKRLSKRKKGSKGFARTQAHRNNFIRWSVNQLNFSNVGEVRMEDLKGMRKGKRLNRFLQGWNYRDIVGVVERKCEERGVRVFKVPRQYTSQRCSECGWVSKDNRKAETFSCGNCGYVGHADTNAARNIALGGFYSPSVPKSVSFCKLHDLL